MLTVWCRAELGYPLFHIALNGCSHITRAAALSELAALPTTAPALCLQIVPAAFRQIIQRQADQPHLKLSEDDVSTTNNSTSRLQALLSRLAQASSNSLDDFKTSLAVSVALSAHHPLVDPKGDSLWSQFVQNSNLNVELLVNAQQETLTAAAMEALLIYPSVCLC